MHSLAANTHATDKNFHCHHCLIRNCKTLPWMLGSKTTQIYIIHISNLTFKGIIWSPKPHILHISKYFSSFLSRIWQIIGKMAVGQSRWINNQNRKKILSTEKGMFNRDTNKKNSKWKKWLKQFYDLSRGTQVTWNIQENRSVS